MLGAIARCARQADIAPESAYEEARHVLVDALGRALRALADPDCRRIVGPVVPGATMAGGARVPGTSYELDPVQGAFATGAMIGWRHPDGAPDAGCGGASTDVVGGILAVADYRSRLAEADGSTGPTVRDLLTALLNARDIRRLLATANGGRGAELAATQIATAAVVAAMLGCDLEQTESAVSAAIQGGMPGTAASHAAAALPWAVGEACSQGVRQALRATSRAGAAPVAGARASDPPVAQPAESLAAGGSGDRHGRVPEGEAGIARLLPSFGEALAAHFTPARVQRIVALVADPGTLDGRPVRELLAALCANA